MSSVGRDEAIITDSHREQTVTDATPSYSTQAKQAVHDVIEKTQAGLHAAKENLQESWNRSQEASTEAANDARPNRGILGTAADKIEETAQKVQNRVSEMKTKAADTASEADLAAQHKATQAKDMSQDAADSLSRPTTTTTTTTETTTSTVPSYTTQAKEALYNVMEKTQQGLHTAKEYIQEKLHHAQESSTEAANDTRDRGIIGKAADKVEETAQAVKNRMSEASTKASDTADEASLAAKHRQETVKDYSKDANAAWQQDSALHE